MFAGRMVGPLTCPPVLPTPVTTRRQDLTRDRENNHRSSATPKRHGCQTSLDESVESDRATKT